MLKTTKITLLSLLVLLPCSVCVAFSNNDQKEATPQTAASSCFAGEDRQQCANNEEDDGFALLHLSSKVTKMASKNSITGRGVLKMTFKMLCQIALALVGRMQL